MKKENRLERLFTLLHFARKFPRTSSHCFSPLLRSDRARVRPLVVLIALSLPLSAQIAFVQQTTATYTSASSVVATLAAAPHPGSALALFSVNNNVVVTGVSGGGVTWVLG